MSAKIRNILAASNQSPSAVTAYSILYVNFNNSIVEESSGRSLTMYGGTTYAGDGAIEFRRASSNYINIGGSSDFQFGSGAYTIQTYVKFLDLSQVHAILSKWTGAYGYEFHYVMDGDSTFKRQYMISNGGPLQQINDARFTPITTDYNHLYVSREENGNVHMGINGQKTAFTPGNQVAYNPTNSDVNIGRNTDGAQYLNADMKSIHVEKGVARFTEISTTYSPPEMTL